MEGFGFQNFDESFESSSPPTYTSDPYGFESTGNRPKKTSKGNKDMYDFDVSNDEEDTPKKAVRTRVVRRMSTDDRMNEILEKSKRSKPAVVSHNVDSKDTEDDTYNSWKNSWNQLMEGVGGDSPKPTALEDSVDSPSLVVAKNRQGNDRVLNTSDSLDISDADFEVLNFLFVNSLWHRLIDHNRLVFMRPGEALRRQVSAAVGQRWKVCPPSMPSLQTSPQPR